MMRSLTTSTAPTGTSSAAAPRRACSSAARMNSSWVIRSDYKRRTRSSSKEELVRWVLVFGGVRVGELVEERAERRQVGLRDFEAGEHASEVGAVIAVMEQTDVPSSAELLEKLRQRAR